MLWLASAFPTVAEIEWTNHGIISHAVADRGIFATTNADDKPIIVAKYGEGMLVIDAKTGETEHYPPPGRFSWASTFGSLLDEEDGKLYSVHAGVWVSFDYNTGEFQTAPLGIFGRSAALAKGPDGWIYAALNPNGELVAFKPADGATKNFGPLVETDWAQLPRSLSVDDQGWVYAGIGRVEQIIAGIHPESEEKLVVRVTDLEDVQPWPGFRAVISHQADNGKVYGRFMMESEEADEERETIWFELYNGEARLLDAPPAVTYQSPKARYWTQVAHDFGDGRHRIREIDFFDRWAEIEDRQSGTTERIQFEYTSRGAPGYSMIMGPDGKVHGSTGKPIRYFIHDPESGERVERALWGHGGHTNALAVQDGNIYGAIYGTGILYRFDPDQPWDDGNPVELYVAGAGLINRPHALVAHPDGKHVIMSGALGTGQTGGGMLIFDTTTGAATEVPDEKVIPNRASFALTALPNGDLVGGTTTSPAAGGAVIEGEAEIYLFDWENKEVKWQTIPVEGAHTIRDLWPHAGDSLVFEESFLYGIATMEGRTEDPVFFVFDLDKQETIHQEEWTDYGGVFSGQGQPIIHPYNDKLYIHLHDGLVEVDPKTYRHRLVGKFPRSGWPGIITPEGVYFFFQGPELWSGQL